MRQEIVPTERHARVIWVKVSELLTVVSLRFPQYRLLLPSLPILARNFGVPIAQLRP